MGTAAWRAAFLGPTFSSRGLLEIRSFFWALAIDLLDRLEEARRAIPWMNRSFGRATVSRLCPLGLQLSLEALVEAGL